MVRIEKLLQQLIPLTFESLMLSRVPLVPMWMMLFPKLHPQLMSLVLSSLALLSQLLQRSTLLPFVSRMLFEKLRILLPLTMSLVRMNKQDDSIRLVS